MIAFTYWDRFNDAQGRRFHCSSTRLVERFGTPIVTNEKLTLPGFSATTFHGDYRCKDNVESSSAVIFDIDGEGTDLDATAEALGDWSGFIYTSFNHTSDRQRARAVLWTTRLVMANEYHPCWRLGASRLPTVGQEAKDPSRLWFVPGVCPGGEYRLIELTGALLDVDEALAAAGPTDEAQEPAPYEPIKVTTPVIDRARKYLDACDIAVSGQHGHRTTFVVAMKLVRGFKLDEATAYALMTHWNRRCDPPWAADELRRKVKQAAKSGRMQPGTLLDAERTA